MGVTPNAHALTIMLHTAGLITISTGDSRAWNRESGSWTSNET